MFTTWDQVRNWIEDNNFPHWIFYKNNPEGRDDKSNDKIIDSNNFVVSDMSDKLAMTEKYLRMAGCKCYGVAFKTPNTTTGGTVCEVRLEPEQSAAAQPVGYMQPQFDEEKAMARIRKEIAAEYERKEYERRLADLERRERELKEQEQSAMGAIAHYLAPVGQALLQRHMLPKVAGVDTEEPVHAQPIVAEQPADQPEEQPEEAEEQSPFTDEEADELFALMAELKQVEPQYLELLRAVVKMAKEGNSTYTMAKNFLIK